MSPRSVSHRPRQETSHQHRGEYQTHTSHLVPSMGPIISVVASHGRQIRSRKADQAAKPGIATVHG